VCRGIEKALTVRSPSVRYAMVAGRLAKWTLPMMLPKRWVDRAMASMTGLTYQKPPPGSQSLHSSKQD